MENYLSDKLLSPKVKIQLKTKDFEDATYPDGETNLKSGCIYMVSDEDMYVDVAGMEFEVAPVPQMLHREAFGWKDYITFLEQEKNEWGMMAFERIFAGLPGYGLLHGPSLLMWLRDTLNWNPLEEIEYDIGGPIDVSFYDKNNHDTWEYSWTFYLFRIAKSKSEQRGNGVHLRIPVLYEKAGKHKIIIYLFIEDFKSYGYQPFDRAYTIGKNYKCSIYVSE